MEKNVEIEMIAIAYMYFNCAALLGFTLRFPIPDSMGNVDYDIIQNNKLSKILTNKVVYHCYGYENI